MNRLINDFLRTFGHRFDTDPTQDTFAMVSGDLEILFDIDMVAWF